MTLVKVHRPHQRRSLSHYDPENWFRGFFNDPFFATESNVWRPAMNAQDTEKEYILSYSLPGFEKDEIQVSMKDHTLTVKAAHKEEQESKSEDYLYREISQGSFERSVRLPESVLGDKVSAEYKSGILTLTVPKSEQALPKEIEVKIT